MVSHEDVQWGTKLAVLDQHEPPSYIAFSPDSSMLVVALHDRTQR